MPHEFGANTLDQSNSSASEPHGAEFLDLLESKHNLVLTELDALNERIEQVLKLYAKGRTTTEERNEPAIKAA